MPTNYGAIEQATSLHWQSQSQRDEIARSLLHAHSRAAPSVAPSVATTVRKSTVPTLIDLDFESDEEMDHHHTANNRRWRGVAAMVAVATMAAAALLNSHLVKPPATQQADDTPVTTATTATVATITDATATTAFDAEDTEESLVVAPKAQPAELLMLDEQLVLEDEYSRRLHRSIGDGLYGIHLAQRHLPTVLSMADGQAHVWTVGGQVQNDGKPCESVEVTFTEDATTVSVDSAWSTNTTVFAKAVRRELRDLSEHHLKAYLHAVEVIYTVRDSEGMTQYGRNYRSADWLVRNHLSGAASKECDHWHDDAGIVNHHVGITWVFEQSLLSVDPTTAAHYWDYTIDAASNSSFETAVVFQEDWFSPVDSGRKDHVVSSGRFAFTNVATDARSFSNVTNPYGLLRSPWNTNPTPYVMRYSSVFGVKNDGYTSMPTCRKFRAALKERKLSSYLLAINGELHGPVHLMIGGHWGMSEKLQRWAKTTGLHNAPDRMLLTSKFLWRQGYVRTPEVCSADTPDSECVASCPEALTNGRSAQKLLNDTGVFSINTVSPDRIAMDEFNVTYDDIWDALCHVGYAGELFTSAAPQDPLFWVLHGLSEKFMAFMRYLHYQGDLHIDMSWGYEPTGAASNTHLVCDWDGVEGLELPECSMSTCDGHHEHDLLPWEFLGQSFTNGEFLQVTAPSNAKEMPYVYDSLSFFAGCSNGTLFD